MKNGVAIRYTIRRKILTLFGGRFHVYDSDNRLILFSKQKGFRLKEDIRIYQDESMDQEKLLIRAQKVIDFSAAYDVIDSAQNKKIGALRRRGFQSLARDSWEFLDANGTAVATLREDSMLLALVRRFVSNLVPQRFEARSGDRLLVTYRRHFNPFVLKLDVEIAPEASGGLDPRLALAAGILLTAIEGRQS